MDGQSCGNCRFYKPPQALGSNLGHCRRYPSQAVHDGDGVDYHFPLVLTSKWCGEWQPANPETVEQGAAVMARLVLLGDKAAAYALIDKLLESRG